MQVGRVDVPRSRAAAVGVDQAVVAAPTSRPSTASDTAGPAAAPSAAGVPRGQTVARAPIAGRDTGAERRDPIVDLARSDHRLVRSGGPSNGDPWSEVPPELEEMLRAELARKGGVPRSGADSEAQVTSGTPDVEAKPTRRTSTRRPAAAASTADAVIEVGAADVAAGPKRRTATRKAASTEAPASGAVVEASTGADAESKPKRRTPTRKAASADAPAAQASAGADAESKPKRRTSTRKAATTEA